MSKINVKNEWDIRSTYARAMNVLIIFLFFLNKIIIFLVTLAMVPNIKKDSMHNMERYFYFTNYYYSTYGIFQHQVIWSSHFKWSIGVYIS